MRIFYAILMVVATACIAHASTVSPVTKSAVKPVVRSAGTVIVQGGGETSPYLDGVVDGAVFEWQATVSDSYSGSGTGINNLIESGGSDYNVVTGDGSTSTTYPTFTGTADDSAAYFAMDGGDYFSFVTGTPSLDLLNKLHQTSTGNAWTLIFSFRYGGTLTQALFDNRLSENNDGILLQIDTSNNVRLIRRSNAVNTITTASNSLTVGTDYIIGITYNQDTNDLDFYINSTTADNFSPSWSANTDDAGSSVATIGSSNGGLVMPSGTRFYAVGGIDAYLNSSDMTAVMNYFASKQSEGRYPFL